MCMCVQSFPLYPPGHPSSERLSYLPGASQLMNESIPRGPPFLVLIPTEPRPFVMKVVIPFPEDGGSEGGLVYFKENKRNLTVWGPQSLWLWTSILYTSLGQLAYRPREDLWMTHRATGGWSQSLSPGALRGCREGKGVVLEETGEPVSATG